MEEREKQAIVDKKEAEELAQRYASLELSTEVKVDAEGRMYGSVAAVDIVKVCAKQDLSIERKNVILPHPIREIGIHNIQLKLKEGVIATLKLNVYGDRVIAKKAPKVEEPDLLQEAPPEFSE
jgi:large subunit ribosomal protein L9